jgi:hypothetical protein
MVSARDRRPSKHISMVSKRFRPVRDRPARVSIEKRMPALIVIRDLQRGCLTSLDIYLRINKGIPDPEIALELRKLISGSQHRSKYRLIAIEHPDSPAPGRGRPPEKDTIKPTATEFRLVRAFEKAAQSCPKVEAAVAQVAEDERVSKAMVYRARKAVKIYRQFETDQRALRERLNSQAESSLTKLRNSQTRD